MIDKKKLKLLIAANLYEDAADLLMMATENKPHITGPATAFEEIKRYSKATKEKFIVIYLNGSHDIIGHDVVTLGLVNRTIVHPREVFRGAILLNACAVILAHNHPSGNMTPSDEDVDITNRMVDAGNIIGINVLDHLIISRKGFVSLVELGMIKR
jgi:DNA repair protein RadC